jgi:4-amino-4-deoxy-L-arabinose transferase-like glycosyltransferase
MASEGLPSETGSPLNALRPARRALSIGAFMRLSFRPDDWTERQTGLFVILIGLLLYIPFAGSYGLYDPWETHYGEVARQMMERGDYISLWWPGAPIDPDHFWSKPVLSFWIESLSMHLFGLRHAASGTMALSSRPEWALRLPFCLFGVLGMYGIYLCVSRFVSRRAGILAALVTATSPLYSLVSRQAMTDMAFVGPMTMALALGALALFDDEDIELPRRSARLGSLRLGWPDHPLFYLTAGLFTAVALPQLIVNVVQLRWTFNLGGHFYSLPGVLVMLPYIAGFLAFFPLVGRFRTRAPLYLNIAATLCGLATLAKGIAGLGLPVIVFLAYLGFTWNWKRLSRAQLGFGILVALLTVAVVAVPWHHAMLVRHGKPFWDELYGDNHWRRLVVGRHGDRGTFEYFLRELGYALLPWIALAPAALGAMAFRRGDATAAGNEKRQGIYWFGAIWFVSAYGLVSLSVTKFHHYILPALPGIAIVVGCFLDDLLARRATRAAAAAALVGIPLLALVIVDLAFAPKDAQHFIWLFSYDYINTPQGRPWPPALDFRPELIGFALLFALATLGLAWQRMQRAALVALCLLAVAFTYFLLDGYLMKVTPYWTQKGLIASYYKMRSSPDEHLLVWQMYWRGENFYTGNEIYEGPSEERTVFLGDKNAENLKSWMDRHRGRRAFFLIERSRMSSLEGMVPADAKKSLKIVDDSVMKFVLASIQL